jgi:hypothetical protein
MFFVVVRFMIVLSLCSLACCFVVLFVASEGGPDSFLSFLQSVLESANRMWTSRPRLLAAVISLLEALWRDSSQFGRHSQVVAKLREAEYDTLFVFIIIK